MTYATTMATTKQKHRKEKGLYLRVDEEFRELVRAKAARRGLTIADYIRSVVKRSTS